jgi:2Fe-2S ferredoxin
LEKESIKFTVIENGISYTIETHAGEYRNLMILLFDKLYFEDFGVCGGQGRCATCLVRIDGLQGESLIKDRNEPVTLSKIGCTEENVRLSCQLLLTKDLDGTIIEVVEQESIL